jgi:hypothetical protein
MIVGIAIRRSSLDAVVVLLADVKLAADNGFDSSVSGSVHKMHRAENISVVGHGHGGHAQFLYPVTEFLHVASAVEHGVVGMEMEVDELRHWLTRFYVGGVMPGSENMAETVENKAAL